MTSSGLVDGSWELSVVVTNVQTTEKVPAERTLRVKGDLHVGGVMLKLVEALGKLFILCKKTLYGLYYLIHWQHRRHTNSNHNPNSRRHLYV